MTGPCVSRPAAIARKKVSGAPPRRAWRGGGRRPGVRRRSAPRRNRRRPPSGDVWRPNAGGVRPKAGGVESTTMDEEGQMDLSVGGPGPRLAQRVLHLRAEGAYHVLAQAQALEAEGRHILHLEVGEPDFLASEEILDSGVEALRAGKARYNPPAGLTALRHAIAEYAGRQRGIDIRPSQVLVSPGAKPNMFFATLALIEPGDEVLYPDPGLPTYAALIGVAGGGGVPVPVIEARGFSFDLEAFDRALSERTRLIILNSPANPTGGVIPREDLEHIAQTPPPPHPSL